MDHLCHLLQSLEANGCLGFRGSKQPTNLPIPRRSYQQLELHFFVRKSWESAPPRATAKVPGLSEEWGFPAAWRELWKLSSPCGAGGARRRGPLVRWSVTCCWMWAFREPFLVSNTSTHCSNRGFMFATAAVNALVFVLSKGCPSRGNLWDRFPPLVPLRRGGWAGQPWHEAGVGAGQVLWRKAAGQGTTWENDLPSHIFLSLLDVYYYCAFSFRSS